MIGQKIAIFVLIWQAWLHNNWPVNYLMIVIVTDRIVTPYLTNNPFDQLFRRPYGSPSRPAFLYPIYHFFSHLIPAFTVDLVLRITGRKPQWVDLPVCLSKVLFIVLLHLLHVWLLFLIPFSTGIYVCMYMCKCVCVCVCVCVLVCVC